MKQNIYFPFLVSIIAHGLLMLTFWNHVFFKTVGDKSEIFVELIVDTRPLDLIDFNPTTFPDESMSQSSREVSVKHKSKIQSKTRRKPDRDLKAEPSKQSSNQPLNLNLPIRTFDAVELYQHQQLEYFNRKNISAVKESRIEMQGEQYIQFEDYCFTARDPSGGIDEKGVVIGLSSRCNQSKKINLKDVFNKFSNNEAGSR